MPTPSATGKRSTRIALLLAFSVAGGALSGMAAIIGIQMTGRFHGPRLLSLDFFASVVPAAGIAGGIVGFMVSPLLMVALYSPPLRLSLRWVYIPAITTAFVFGLPPALDPSWTYLSVPVFIVMSFIARAVLPKLHTSEGLCPHCGYNLTGNTSGKCPECGNGPHALYKS